MLNALAEANAMKSDVAASDTWVIYMFSCVRFFFFWYSLQIYIILMGMGKDYPKELIWFFIFFFCTK